MATSCHPSGAVAFLVAQTGQKVSPSKPKSTHTHMQKIVFVPKYCVSGSNRVPYNKLVDNKITVNLMHKKAEKCSFILLFQVDFENDLFTCLLQEIIPSSCIYRGEFVSPDAKFVANANIFSEMHTYSHTLDHTPGSLYVISTAGDQCIFIAFIKHPDYL